MEIRDMTREYTRFEKARIIGARSLQISMGAPPLIDLESSKVDDPVDIAMVEFNKEVIPISVIREE